MKNRFESKIVADYFQYSFCCTTRVNCYYLATIISTSFYKFAKESNLFFFMSGINKV